MNVRKGVLLLLIGALAFLSFLLVRPYIQYVLASMLLAYVLAPAQQRLEPKLGATWAAAALVFGATVALLIPFILLLGVVAGEAARIGGSLSTSVVGEQLTLVETQLNERLGRNIDLVSELSSRLEGFAQTIAGSAPDFVAAVTHVLIGLGLAVFLLYYLLRDGDRLVAWLRSVTPLPEQVQETLIDRLDDITRAVLIGHVLVAIVQGVIAGIGLLIVGVSNVLFWTAVMILLALLPFIGTFLVWGPIAVYLLATGSTLSAAFLFVYGTIVVGVSDEYLRPVLVDRYAEVSPAIIVVGVIGGLSVFGVMGLFVGPIVVGALKVALEVFDRHYGDL
ncbi:AI-2E family transporter [Haloferacaceae archaeon DSL9]